MTGFRSMVVLVTTILCSIYHLPLSSAESLLTDVPPREPLAHVPSDTISDHLPSHQTVLPPKMSPLRKVAQAVAFSSALQVAMLPSVMAGSPTVCDNPQLSCQSSLSTTSSCCLNSPGGQLLLTQFWDTNPPTGPTDSWTLHGLWPDKCDGTFEANCDSSRAYSNIIDILTSFGATDVLDFMNTYWKDYQGQDEQFWSHEWTKHGTCISTLSPDCYTDYTPQQEVVDFFNITTALFQTLPTYTTLANAGIVPSTTTTYRAADIEAAIQAVHGYPVTIGCKNGAFDQVWYHYNVQGSVQTGTFIATTPDGTKSTCPKQGIRYLPKACKNMSPLRTASGVFARLSGRGRRSER